MKKLANNFAFIDSQNVNLAIRVLGWVGYRRFFMNDLQNKLEYKKRTPKGRNPKEDFS